MPLTTRCQTLAVAALAAGTLCLATLSPAQAPAPFRTVPADAQAILRIDFAAIESNASLAPVLAKVREQDPNFPQSLLSEIEGSQSYRFLAEELPGNVRIVEMGFRNLDSDTPNGFMTVYGTYDRESLDQKFEANGWTSATMGELTYWTNADEEAALVPNDFTILMSDNAAGLQSMFDAAATDNSVRTGHADFSGIIGAADRSLVYFALGLRDSDRAQLRTNVTMMQQDPNAAMMMAMMPGAMPLMNELAQLHSTMVMINPGQESGLLASIGFNLPGEQNAATFASSFNQTLPMAVQMLAMFAQGDPQATQALETISQVRLQNMGNRAFVSLPITDAMIAQAVAAMSEVDPNAVRGALSR